METPKKKIDLSFNPSIPIVHSLNSYSLEKAGFKRNGTAYTKDNTEVKYDGVYWWCNGQKVEFLEDLTEKK